MALVEKQIIDKVEIVNLHDLPSIQVRVAKWVEDDATGKIVGAPSYQRSTIAPDGAADIGDNEMLMQIHNSVMTTDVQTRYAQRKAEMAARRNPNA